MSMTVTNLSHNLGDVSKILSKKTSESKYCKSFSLLEILKFIITHLLFDEEKRTIPAPPSCIVNYSRYNVIRI